MRKHYCWHDATIISERTDTATRTEKKNTSYIKGAHAEYIVATGPKRENDAAHEHGRATTSDPEEDDDTDEAHGRGERRRNTSANSLRLRTSGSHDERINRTK